MCAMSLVHGCSGPQQLCSMVVNSCTNLAVYEELELYFMENFMDQKSQIQSDDQMNKVLQGKEMPEPLTYMSIHMPYHMQMIYPHHNFLLIITCMGNKSNLKMFLSPTDPYEVAKLIDSLKRTNSSGHDGLTSALIKDIKNDIAISGATSSHKISGTSIGGTTFSNMIIFVDLDLFFQNMTLVLHFPVAS